ncbi:MAG: hypothetical protein WBX25_03615 [Rhodomicrobium sp.]
MTGLGVGVTDGFNSSFLSSTGLNVTDGTNTSTLSSTTLTTGTANANTFNVTGGPFTTQINGFGITTNGFISLSYGAIGTSPNQTLDGQTLTSNGVNGQSTLSGDSLKFYNSSSVQTVAINGNTGTASFSGKITGTGGLAITGGTTTDTLTVTGATTTHGINNSGSGITNAGAVSGVTSLTGNGTGSITGFVNGTFTGTVTASTLSDGAGTTINGGVVSTVNGNAQTYMYSGGIITNGSIVVASPSFGVPDQTLDGTTLTSTSSTGQSALTADSLKFYNSSFAQTIALNGNTGTASFTGKITGTGGLAITGGTTTDTLAVTGNSTFNTTTTNGLATFNGGATFNSSSANGNTTTINATTGAFTQTGNGTGAGKSIVLNASADQATFTGMTVTVSNIAGTSKTTVTDGSITSTVTGAGTTNVTGGFVTVSGTYAGGVGGLNVGNAAVYVSGGSITNNGAIVNGGFVANGGSTLNGGATVNGPTQLNGSLAVAPGNNISMGGNVVHDVATPIVGTDAANKAYVDKGVNKAFEGTALALAISQPMFMPGQSFAIRAGWGDYQSQNAFGVSAAGVIARDVFGYGSTIVVDGGVGVGGNYNGVAGKAGVTIGFGGGAYPIK